MKSFYGWLLTNEIIAVNGLTGANPIIRQPPTKKERQVITREDYDRLKAEALKPETPPHWYGAILIGWNTGLRVADIAQLEWSEVKLEAGSIQLIPQKQKRQGKMIEVPMNPELLTWMRRQRELVPTGKQFVQPYMAGSYLLDGRANTLGQEFLALYRRAGLPPGKSFHALRRSFVSRAIIAGIQPAMVSQLTGQSIKTVMTYVSVPLETKRSEMEKMQNL